MPKQPQVNKESPQPRRGRPPQADSLTPAERARRYREKQKAEGLVKRYVAEDADPNMAIELREMLLKTMSERDYFKKELARLHNENDGLLNRALEAERFHTNSLKELIAIRQKLTGMDSKPSEVPSKGGLAK